MLVPVELKVNGSERRLEADPRQSLLGVLRDELDLTGTKYGCGEGKCGACTVLLDGEAVRSCITPVRNAQGKEITTIEGLARDGELHPVQQAFLDAGAMQCGYCTPGMILAAVSFLAGGGNPRREDIVRALEGNICRCGVHPRVIQAIEIAARAVKEKRP